MAVFIVDYTGDYIYQDCLPKHPNLLILCEEYTLVSDSLKAILMQDSNLQILLKGGVFVYRLPSDFQRGCVIGLVLSSFQGSKLFTPRRELYSGTIPNVLLEFLYQPVQPLCRPAGSPYIPANKQQGPEFEEVYEESLQKYTKKILMEKHIRSTKSTSLIGQLKNIVIGVVNSMMKKSGKGDSVNMDLVVDTIIEDLEDENIVRVNAGKVDYDDALIEAFFSLRKSKLFVPKRRKPALAKAENPLPVNQAVLNVEPLGFLQENQSIKFVPNYSSLDALNIKKVNPDKDSFPVYQAMPLSNSPALFQTVHSPTEVALEPVKNPINRGIFRPEPPKFNWELYDEAITDQIINTVCQTDDIATCLKLFQICNRVTRNFLDENSLTPNDADIPEKVAKSMKFILEAFFRVNSHLSIDELVQNLQKNGFVTLTRLN